MKAKSLLWTIAVTTVFLLFISGLHLTEAKKVTVHPLSARDVYRLLRVSGREDAVPEGRVVTQGLAALTGFALGIKKGIGGALLFDLITANTTALFGMVGNTGGSTSGSTTTSQEICFSSRSARNLQEAEAIAEAYSRLDGKSDEGKVRRSETPRRLKRNHRSKRGRNRGYTGRNDDDIEILENEAEIVDDPLLDVPSGTSEMETVAAPISTSLISFSPTSMESPVVSEPGPGPINCIVIQK